VPIFVALGTATESGRSRTLEGLAERHARAVARAEDAGARVLASYALLGPYDYLTLLDAPDIETVARVLIREAARGNVHYEIHPALPMEQFARLVGEEEVIKPHRLVRSRSTRSPRQAAPEEPEASHRVRRQGTKSPRAEKKE
jgi:uncharacterized protein with GYD domain